MPGCPRRVLDRRDVLNENDLVSNLAYCHPDEGGIPFEMCEKDSSMRDTKVSLLSEWQRLGFKHSSFRIIWVSIAEAGINGLFRAC